MSRTNSPFVSLEPFPYTFVSSKKLSIHGPVSKKSPINGERERAGGGRLRTRGNTASLLHTATVLPRSPPNYVPLPAALLSPPLLHSHLARKNIRSFQLPQRGILFCGIFRDPTYGVRDKKCKKSPCRTASGRGAGRRFKTMIKARLNVNFRDLVAPPH